jgi:DNA (cytosine-5)-methyltransferase 1
MKNSALKIKINETALKMKDGPVPKALIMKPDTAGPINLARPLTTTERAQVQTFPKNFKWVGSKTNVEQMIGNAVPVNLGKFVAECILTYVKKLN